MKSKVFQVGLLLIAGVSATLSIILDPGHFDPAFAGLRITNINVAPSQLTLRSGDTHHLLVNGLLEDGLETDVTSAAEFKSQERKVASITPEGAVLGLQPGVTTIRVRALGRKTMVQVHVEPAVANQQLSFVNDILPVLSKAGCNAGSCHAKAEGQNRFKLSVFAYDPKSDYRQIVKADRGRRVFPACPEESLILKKPTLAIEHEGGQRFETGSPSWLTLKKWIEQGMPYAQSNEANLAQVKVYPAERRYKKGAKQKLIVEARYSDGSVRDVTSLADFSSPEKEMSKVDENGRITVGQTSGEGVVIARFMGLVDVSRVTVPADKALPDSLYASLPVNNEIDKLVYARLKKLGLAPSETCTDSEFLRRASLDSIGRMPDPDLVKEFLANTNGDKRERIISYLLDDSAYADHWAVKWGDFDPPKPVARRRQAGLPARSLVARQFSAEQTNTTNSCANCSPPRAARTNTTTWRSFATNESRWRRVRLSARSSWASGWSARNVIIIRTKNGARRTIISSRHFSGL